MDIYSTINLHGLQWDRLTHHRLQGNLLEIPGAPPPAPSSLTLVPAKLFLLHSLTLSDCNCFCATFSFLKSVIPGMLPPPLVGSALACSGSILLPAGIGSDRYEGNFWHLLTEVSPVAPATKALLHNSNTGTALNFTMFSVARVISGLMWMQAAFYTRQNLTQKTLPYCRDTTTGTNSIVRTKLPLHFSPHSSIVAHEQKLTFIQWKFDKGQPKMMFIVSQAQQLKWLSVALQFSMVVAKQHIENNVQYDVVYRNLQC